MTFAILGGGQLDTGYTIDNSLRFNDDDSAVLSRTPGTAGDRKTYTISTWIKRSLLTSQIQPFLECYLNANQWTSVSFGTDDKIQFYHVDSGTDYGYKTDMVFRDVSAWYHIVIALDTTQATAANRMILYVNGNETTFDQNFGEFPQNDNTWINSTNGHNIGKYSDQSKYFDGYMAEYNFIDGQQLTASDFGEFDEDSGIWKPKAYEGTYTGNSFYLDFENSGSLGADASGLGNNWTPTNLASTDQTTDTPTNNFATLNPLVYTSGGANYSEGNVKVSTNNATRSGGVSTQGVSIGKWYWEIKLTSGASNSQLGISYNPQELTRTTTAVGETADSWSYVPPTGKIRNNAVDLFSASTLADSDIMNIALDLDNNYVYFGKNGTWQNSGDPTSGASGTGGFSLTAGEEYFFIGGDRTTGGGATQEVNFGNPSFSISSGNSDDNGYGNFEYAPPTGFLALCTQNLATELSPTIDDGSQYFNTLLYTGNGTNPRSLTGVGFQPDFTWIKNRTDTWGHGLADSTRGGGKTLISNSTAVEQTNYTWGYVDSFDSDGFTVDDGASGDDFVNQTSDNYVSWNWLANGGTTSSNTDGSITSTVQANPTAGFSIVTYSGNQTDGATVGHGLGIAPQVVIIKERNGTSSWIVKHPDLTDAGYYLILEADNAESTAANVWSDTDPSSTVFTLGDSTAVNENTLNYVAYCFAEIEGYSKFGKYTGNGSTNGTFVYTGFRPAFVLWKRTDGATDWRILDTTRDSYNVANKRLFPNTNGAENTAQDTLDFLSNGFKLRATNAGGNFSGGNYVYMCFAENPFVSSAGVPVVAR